LFYGEVCKKRRRVIILFTRTTLITESSIFDGVSSVYLFLLALLGHETLVADVGEEKFLVGDNVGGILVGGVGGALVGVLLLTLVCLATLFLVVVLLLLHLLIPLLVAVPVTTTCIWTFSNIITELTTSVANPLGVGFVLLPFPLLEDLLEALNDKIHLLIVKLGGINCEPFGWRGFLLLFFRCLECNGLRLGVEAPPCSNLTMCLESLTISSKLTNLSITSLGDICSYLRLSCVNRA
jgi:hypothetical protein